ncbi:complexin-3-like [Hippocampus comes]|uniref:complexin-3-like n=1 Tax=Hippocampus comes TaxID=109280 RepID=UPI00094F1601|nr:PREDICTED: complexin-3-like [Hippocampus comes]XP_019737125.1 PREDICTED: complexin-3-like [Hippocampus comes]
MESMARVKKSLRAPIRRLSSCMCTVSNRKWFAKSRTNRFPHPGGRGRCGRSGKAPPRRTPSKYPSVVRAYQADLDKERKLRKATNAQKNAERAAMRSHFRRKYQLAENSKDASHLKCVGGKVSLPRELSKLLRPDSKTKDDGFNLLDAFRGLSLGPLAEGKGAKRAAATPHRGRSCQVM